VGVDVTSTNGVLHKLAGVLVPDIAQIAFAAAGLKKTTAVVQEVSPGLWDTLSSQGPYTLFGPVDECYGDDQLPSADVLTYHVAVGAIDFMGRTGTFDLSTLSGLVAYAANNSLNVGNPYVKANSSIYIDNAQVLLPVFPALNGMVYPISQVLQPAVKDVLAVLEENSETRTFAAWLQGAGLGEKLKGDGPFTVFAPATSVLDGLWKTPQIAGDSQVASLMAYHIVDGRFFPPQLSNTTCTVSDEGYCRGVALRTWQGQTIEAQVVSENEMYMSTPYDAFTAKLSLPDINCKNGVVHVVQGVMTYEGYRRPT
jgi:transforming growth factor-beta-induced protein